MDGQDGNAPIGRRIFLGILALTGAGVIFGSRAQSAVERLAGSGGAGGPFALLPLGRFRIYSVTGTLPSRSREAFRLTVDGLVSRPAELTFADIEALPSTEIVRDFQCVTGWRVRRVRWRGVPLRTVLERAGIAAGAAAVSFRSFDGEYSESLTLEQAMRPDVLVAYALDAKPLSSAHGGPVRLYVAPMYGYKSCKWLERIEVTAAAEPGYWEIRGYDADAWVGRSNGRDDAPI